ncbi:LPS export ABC transporter periplasmic protein LptC [Vibrio algicola]|uniref:Lipopolysaccharide export system protein LptC n=1 Tax=Vibrio algicola TaxID=2662262 RepID=A0A5Q0TEG4_9VIBR|nr:LPS export ABC transporter periplasmic protein LptC [Vibrio algicola]
MSFSRLMYLILIIIACGSGYYLYQKSSSDSTQITLDKEHPLFTSNDLNSVKYNLEGTRDYKIYAVTLENYAQSGDTVFHKPVLTIYQQGKIVEWVVNSDTAVLDKDHKLTLIGHVVAKNNLPDSSFDTMNTEKMLIDLKSKDFSSDTKVFMIGPQFTNSGNALEGNFKSNIATLFNQVQGKYETLTP